MTDTKETLNIAEKALAELEDKILDEYINAKLAIAEKHKPERDKLLAIEKAAIIAHNEFLNGQSHEWEGKRVWKLETKWTNWGADKTEKIFGVVQVRKFDTEFSGNLSRYNKPALGAAFVRLETASGKLGKNISRWGLTDWQLV